MESDVLYAELVWGGSSNYADEDVTGSLDTPIKLTAGGSSMMVSPDPTTALTIAQTAQSGFAANYYMRVIGGRDRVREDRARREIRVVSGVPATQPETIKLAERRRVEPHRRGARRDRAGAKPQRLRFGGSFVDENSSAGLHGERPLHRRPGVRSKAPW